MPRDQPQPGSFLNKREEPGNEVGKAEGLQKFSFPMADCIFGNCLDDPKEMEIQSLVSRLTELHFYSGRNGWTNEIIEFHRKLAWRLNIYKLKKSKVYKCVPYLFTTFCTFMRIL